MSQHKASWIGFVARAGAMLLALVASVAQATTLLVSSNADAPVTTPNCAVSGGFGSCNMLRDAIAYALANPDTTTHQTTIYFKSFYDGATINLTAFSNDPGCVTTSATTCYSGTLGAEFGPSAFFINSPGQTIIIDASTDDNGVPFKHGVTIARDTNAADYPGSPATAPGFRLFDIGIGSNLTLRGITLAGGVAQGHGSFTGGGALGAGGAIFNQGTLVVERCSLIGNLAQGGNTDASEGSGSGAGVGTATDSSNDGGSPNGGAKGGYLVSGSDGGFGGGGGGATGGAGAGGFGGGGGNADEVTLSGGGFGGGNGGNGGFGGGGGAAGNDFTAGIGGFGGGDGRNHVGFGGGGAGMGGAIFNDAGTVQLTNTTLHANTATGGTGYQSSDGSGLGGAIFNYNGSLTIDFSTLSANGVAGSNGIVGPDGGAVYSLGDGSCNNTGAAPSGGNICNGTTAILTISNSIMANGSGSTTGDVVTKTVNTGGGEGHSCVNSLSGTLTLGAFTNPGGFNNVLVPPMGSPAINAAQCGTNTVDERGKARPDPASAALATPCDIGAVEYYTGKEDLIFKGGFDDAYRMLTAQCQ